jgi:hypothetical protein
MSALLWKKYTENGLLHAFYKTKKKNGIYQMTLGSSGKQAEKEKASPQDGRTPFF